MFQRIINFWVQTFVTERLLASPLFHRMAAKTHHHVSSLTEKGKLSIRKLLKQQRLTYDSYL
jgi:hypothetical protein